MLLSARACSFALAELSAFKFLIVFSHWSTHGQNYLTSTCFFCWSVWYCSKPNPVFDSCFIVGKITRNLRKQNHPNSLRHSGFLSVLVTRGLYTSAAALVWWLRTLHHTVVLWALPARRKVFSVTWGSSWWKKEVDCNSGEYLWSCMHFKGFPEWGN